MVRSVSVNNFFFILVGAILLIYIAGLKPPIPLSGSLRGDRSMHVAQMIIMDLEVLTAAHSHDLWLIPIMASVVDIILLPGRAYRWLSGVSARLVLH